nr:acetoacetate decarboxylase family protein [Vulcanisaeta sp. JCM 14467]
MSGDRIRGRLSVRNLWSMPGNTPLFAGLPQYFPDAEVLQVFFETDPEGAAEVVPEDLEVPVPTEAIITFFKFPFSTLVLIMSLPWTSRCSLMVGRSTTRHITT